jgi:hypothetical protein
MFHKRIPQHSKQLLSHYVIDSRYLQLPNATEIEYQSTVILVLLMNAMNYSFCKRMLAKVFYIRDLKHAARRMHLCTFHKLTKLKILIKFN